ncbi:MAG: hypothetical protein KJ600_04145 [Nanoarchaeota archaeon]|nr:hypothetical protein [Nanoarchaeota archaeon]MBU1103718.1 hypothetical protein [Nanoarchaeota archaeon]
MSDSSFVEAIEDGKIVKVSENYAKREGLVILRKPEIKMNNPGTTPSYFSQESKESKKPLTDYLKKKPDWKEKQVLQELLDNFHWHIRMQRRRMGLTRRQFSKMINESEEKVKILETGRLPTNDFVIINKVQKALGINLRKDKKNFDVSVKEMLNQKKEEPKQEGSDFAGSGIEILEDEI